MMPSGGIDFEALKECEKDMEGLMHGDMRTRQRVDAQAEEEIKAAHEAELTPSERREKEAKQEAHAAKIRMQRAETETKEAEAAKARRLQARTQTAGVMGVGRVPVDVGDMNDAFEYELEFGEVTLYVPLPEGVKAKQLAVDVAVTSLSIGLKGKPPYLRGTFGGKVKHDEDVVWTIEQGFLKLELSKADVRESWAYALKVPDNWQCSWHRDL